MNVIHPSSIVASDVELDGVKIGPFCVIQSGVKIAKGTELISHVYIDSHASIGADNVIFPYVSIGMRPQDLKYGGEPSRVRIGDRNHIRESVTIHRGTSKGHMETVIGSDCLLMAYTHVAHDCLLGSHVVLANSAALGGHVEIGSYATLGGLSAVHQFCKVGEHAFLSGGTMINLDVPPYTIAEGRRASLVGINVIGLQRHGFSLERIQVIKRAYREFYQKGLSLEEACRHLEMQNHPDIKLFVDFIRQSKRGVSRPLWNDIDTEIED